MRGWDRTGDDEMSVVLGQLFLGSEFVHRTAHIYPPTPHHSPFLFFFVSSSCE